MCFFIFTGYCSFIFFVLFCGLFSSSFSKRVYSSLLSFFSLDAESEKEVGSEEDALLCMYLLALLLLYFCFALYFYFTNVAPIYFAAISLFFLIIFFALSTPASISLDAGVTWSSTLRGSASSTSFSKEFVYDKLALTIAFARILVQNVRIVIILLCFIELKHLFFIYSIESVFSFDLYKKDINNLNLFSFYDLVVFAVDFIFNIVHLMYVIPSQSSIYVILVFWLFSFLYTCFSKNNFELYFRVLRGLRFLAKNKLE